MFDTIIKGGTLMTPWGRIEADLAIKDGEIADLGSFDGGQAAAVIDATGLHILPGVIDTQVHFREPGLEHKEDLESGSRGAVKGGVTSVFEMPNTSPPTITTEALAYKVSRGRNRMFCDFAFFAGAAEENIDTLPVLERQEGVCGVKLFMGSSTGSLLVADDPTIERVLASGRRRVAIHAEDEFRLEDRQDLSHQGGVHSHPVWRDEECARLATERVIRAARKVGRKIHVLHVTTKFEPPMLAAAKDIATMEVTPQHLTLAAPECYDRLGSFAQMNPPIRGEEHRAALWEAVRLGIVDVIGSDHAPHTREEKARDYPASPSGMPGVQTLLPLMLNHVSEGRLSLERLVDLTAHGPQRIYQIAQKGRIAVGFDADLTLVDLNATRTITDEWMETKSGWTPFAGMQVKGWPVATLVRGQTVMQEDEILAPAIGQPVRFLDTHPGL